MREEEFIEPFAVQEFYVDGFAKHVAKDGVMSCVGYREMKDGKIVVIRLVWPAVNTEAAIEEARGALSAPIKGPPNLRIVP